MAALAAKALGASLVMTANVVATMAMAVTAEAEMATEAAARVAVEARVAVVEGRGGSGGGVGWWRRHRDGSGGISGGG